ncbi:MAG: VOC family protein [Halioglobus sp.]
MSEHVPHPRLRLGHSTLLARDLDAMLTFYCNALGFHVTNRGKVGEDAELAFLSQDPSHHHQIALVSGSPVPERAFMMLDHLAFRTGTLNDLRSLHERLTMAGVTDILPICHGNAWSLYFTDPEGNGVECYVDTPFHVAQPAAGGFDLAQTDEEILEATRAAFEGSPEFQPMDQWRQKFAHTLNE